MRPWDSPAVRASFFQMGTSPLVRSMPWRHASNASARWGAEQATTTAASPMASSPVRCSSAALRTGHRSSISAATSRMRLTASSSHAS